MKARYLIPGLAAALLATSAFASPPAAAPPAPASATAPLQHASRVSTSELYRRAQQKLKDMNLYTGAVDGRRSGSYVHALERFQREHHLTADGRLNQSTRAALGI